MEIAGATTHLVLCSYKMKWEKTVVVVHDSQDHDNDDHEDEGKSIFFMGNHMAVPFLFLEVV